ncbi:jg8784 [Pararge aegeria aegeria]|uniref:Jg8784 protein n=1 Tax=Pararge aegeria aegeria TaxID=348720 RepID=A0A8S4S1H3_9NEOP|nr:jg8784 [Pararge aegeria aegeria]
MRTSVEGLELAMCPIARRTDRRWVPRCWNGDPAQFGQNLLTRLNTDNSSLISSKPEILRAVEKFYGQLYNSTQKPVENLAIDPGAKLTEGIPDVSLYEISIALKPHKNSKVPGDDGITAELLKAGGKTILKVFQRLFNSVIHQGTTPVNGTGAWWFCSSKKVTIPCYRTTDLSRC